MDYQKLAEDIVRLVGGTGNIRSVTHCMTRLRFVVNNVDRADQKALEELDGVLGVIYAGGQLMVVLGKNLPPTYEAVVKLTGAQETAPVDENLDPELKEPLTVKGALMEAINYVSSSVSPVLPGLVAGGMLKVILLLITLAVPSFATDQTYLLLSAIADAPFFFMPIFVAYGASTKLGGTPIYAMAAAAALLHGNYTALVAAGDAVALFGIPVRLVSYSSQLLPALLVALLAFYAEKLFNKIVPGIFKSLLVGLLTIVVTGFFGFTVLGPLGSYVGDVLSTVFVFLGGSVGPIALALLAACLPWLVMCGMHMALVPFMTQAATVNPGYDTLFRPAFIFHNMAEGGACLGVALRTRDKQLRSEALGIGFGCIVAGVTEPAIYGINLRYKRPMIGVMAGGAAGGIVGGLFGVRAYEMGYSTVLALPIFLETAVGMAIAIVVAIVVAAVVAAVLGIEEPAAKKGTPAADSSADALPERADTELVAVVDGEQVPLSSVADKTFASGMLGEGVAFVPKGEVVVAPCNGTVSALFPTGHAFGVTRPDGVEVLVHIGINTVELEGKGMTVADGIKMGDTVRAGQPMVRLDASAIRGAGYDLTTMLIVTDPAGHEVSFVEPGARVAGDVISR